jgi:prevent-host-death family protein
VAQVTAKEARAHFSALLERAEAGEEIAIYRRGKQVARIVPPRRPAGQLPDLANFRASISVGGEPLSETVIRQRGESRY